MTWPRILAVVAGLLIASAVGTFVLRDVVDQQDRNTEQLRVQAATDLKIKRALRVSCILLQTAILQAGASAVQAEELSDAAKAQRELTALYIAVLSREMTPAEEAKAARLVKRISAGGGAVTLPKCDEIVQHPERVEALDIIQKQRNRRKP